MSLLRAITGLRAGRITADEYRAIMRASREEHGEAEHERLKMVAISNLDRA